MVTAKDSGDFSEADDADAGWNEAVAAAKMEQMGGETNPADNGAAKLWEWPPPPRQRLPKLAGALPLDLSRAEKAAGRKAGQNQRAARLLVNEYGIPAIEFS